MDKLGLELFNSQAGEALIGRDTHSLSDIFVPFILGFNEWGHLDVPTRCFCDKKSKRKGGEKE
jgi:hypothetical protein